MKEKPEDIAEIITNERGKWGITKAAESVANIRSERERAAFVEDLRDEIEAYLFEQKYTRQRALRACYDKFPKEEKIGGFILRQRKPEGIDGPPQDMPDNHHERSVRERMDFFVTTQNDAAEKVAAEASTEPAAPNPLNLPPAMNTERAVECIQKAIEKGWIVCAASNELRWNMKPGRASLAFFMAEAYRGERFPAKDIERLFWVKESNGYKRAKSMSRAADDSIRRGETKYAREIMALIG